MQHLEVCLPSCIKSLGFLRSFHAAATRNTATIKILSLFIVGLILCLSYLWLTKASLTGGFIT